MRISDWSSDVCSSDLGLSSADGSAWKRPSIGLSRIYSPPSANPRRGSLPFMRPAVISRSVTRKSTALSIRSEEHTSELQSLMRISYAVFCLKKKKTKLTKNHTHQKDNIYTCKHNNK